MSLFSRLSQIQQLPHLHDNVGAETLPVTSALSNRGGRQDGENRYESGESHAYSHLNNTTRLDPSENNYAEVAPGGSGNNAKKLATTTNSKKSLKDLDAVEGVLIRTLKPGDVTNFPKKGDKCSIHYEAFTEQEMMSRDSNPVPFDSSRSRGQVFYFQLGLGQVIEGLDVAVSKMSIGQEVEATIPYPYAYGVAGYPPVVPPRATLIFRVELISFSSVL